ncbi:hypothetical protein CTAYLR_009231 [Chrysophaeum taylorii]|uniref:Pre-mRNA processing factor 4 (PRP4)-like domain-containing protein n=1 Tax=Chrysophaeum taylorii TaxID=2483200 RepID=A0AAD7UHD6_9STRA|nr:hypothetical protein CTAYLR_009231 [Chrysophaeum taylorii]
MSASYGAAVAAAMRAGNMVAPTMVGGVQYGELSETSKGEQLRHAALLKRVDAEKRARRIVVPTDEVEVRGMLRKLGHPVRLFGETPADVRERLRDILARIEVEDNERELVAALLADPAAKKDTTSTKMAADAKDEVYTAASPALVAARREIARLSFDSAARRLSSQRRRRDDQAASFAREEYAAQLYFRLARLSLSQSQFADARPVSRVRACPTAALLATGSWSGRVEVWNALTCARASSFDAPSDDRVTGLAWTPDGRLLVSGSADAAAYVWALDDATPRIVLRGHGDRLANVAAHPLGSYVGTTSFDHTWRLWDIETADQLLLQDGHGKEVYAISFQRDGAILATGDFAGVVHCWDLRSGRRVHTCLGHGKKILASDFSPDGYQLATASDDNTVRIWDLRRKACDYVLPAHSSLISDCRFSPTTGEALATACFDGSVALWATRDWSNLLRVPAHDGKTMSLDFVDETALVTAGFDRTFKLWTLPDNAKMDLQD